MTARRPTLSHLARLCCALIVAAVLAVLVPQGVDADLKGQAEERAAVAGRSDQALVDANPILKQLQIEHPEVLPVVLERLRTAAPIYRRSLSDGTTDPEQQEQIDDAVLDDNPDFAQLHRESPEAALDLLRLIREATKKQ